MVVSSFRGFQGCAAAGDRAIGVMKNCGAGGFVVDGPVRDYPGVVAIGLPVWCTGLTPASPFSKGPGCVGFPVQIAGQQVATGDMVVATWDGVVVVPFDRIDAVIAMLARVTEPEDALDAEIANGLTVPDSIRDLLDSDRVHYTG